MQNFQRKLGDTIGRVSPAKIKSREADLTLTIKSRLPEFAKACVVDEAPVILLHQDAFAADYQEEEFALLGMAIKYAGMFGKEVRITGKNRETVIYL